METGKDNEFVIEKTKGMLDKPITFENTRITCASADTIEKNKNYTGLIVYSIGTYDAKKETV